MLSTRRTVTVALLLLLLPLAPARADWTEDWSTNGQGWVQSGGTPTFDCANGYLTGCALKAQPTPCCTGLSMERTLEQATPNGDSQYQFRVKASTLGSQGYVGVSFTLTMNDGSWRTLTLYANDGTTYRVASQDFDLEIGRLPQTNTYYYVLVNMGGDGLMSYDLYDAPMTQRVTSNPLHSIGTAVDIVHAVQIATSSDSQGGSVWIDDVAVQGIAPMTAPDAPGTVEARTLPAVEELLVGDPGPGPGEVIVSWDEPSNTGNRPILRYILTRENPDGSVRTIYQGPERTFRDHPGTGQFLYRVHAVNAIGTSPASAPAAAVTVVRLPAPLG